MPPAQGRAREAGRFAGHPRAIKSGSHRRAHDRRRRGKRAAAQALSRRGIVENVLGSIVYGDYREPNPAARLVESVARATSMWLSPGDPWPATSPRGKAYRSLFSLFPALDAHTLSMIFDISMGLRREDVTLKVEVEAALERLRPAIDAVLVEYGLLRLDPPRYAR
jgi:mxaJ protein